jgi:putative acetyltransferase
VFDHSVRPDLAAEFLADPRHHLAVAREAGRIVGFASAVHYVHPDKPPELWVNEVGVAETHQRRGLATGLLRALFAAARAAGCQGGWVLTDRSNSAAIALYSGLGGVEAPGETVMFEFPFDSPPAPSALVTRPENRTTLIRLESPDDVAAVRQVNALAFGQPAEANLVDKLRAACREALSLVAVDDVGEVVAHILFTPVGVESHGRRIVGMGLAPMAVRPDCQRQGIGSELVRRGLSLLTERGCPFVVVVGHAAYYPRFGFAPASRHGLASQWDGMPDEAFMVMILDQPFMTGVRGVARYRDEFDEVG